MEKCKFYVREEVFLTPTSEHKNIEKYREYCIHENSPRRENDLSTLDTLECHGDPNKCIIENVDKSKH